MYHNREDDRYHKRRDHGGDQDDSKERCKARKNRWDEKESDSTQSRSRWSGISGESRSSATLESSGERNPGESEPSTSQSRSGDRKNCRSRSRSPFRRDFRDCVNPTKDGYSYQSDFSNHSSSGTEHQARLAQKHTSWSDSSDEDDRSGKSNRFHNPTRSPGQPSQQHHDHKKHEVPFTAMPPKHASGDEMGSSSSSGISLKLGGSSVKPTPLPKVISVAVPVKSSKVAAIFNDDDDDEPEEMPAECKMRMKNVGRETKTSEGPNSFGKTKIGFCNMSHLAEKQLGDKIVAKKRP